MLDEICRRITSFFLRLKRKDCKFNKKCNVDFRNCSFAGGNYVGEKTILRRVNMNKYSYVADHSVLFDVEIGKYCSIGSYVKNVAGRHPTEKFVSTHPMFYSTHPINGTSYVGENLFPECKYAIESSRKYVKIGNDVWIGDSVQILDGITIADGTIVGTGAVVTKDTEPYSIIGGVPAKIIRYRFTENEIENLLESKWWDKDEEWIRANSALLCNISLFMEKNNEEW